MVFDTAPEQRSANRQSHAVLSPGRHLNDFVSQQRIHFGGDVPVFSVPNAQLAVNIVAARVHFAPFS